jgi:hypothetical protein
MKNVIIKDSVRTRPLLWKKIVSDIKKSNKGGKSGQWSARKAQLAVNIYKKSGGKYLAKKSKSNSLYKWTKQKWTTRSGRASVTGPNPSGERYLPEKFIKKIGKKDYYYSSRLKRISLKKNKQYSKQPSKLGNKLAHFLRN